jgi:hypothetical protein
MTRWSGACIGLVLLTLATLCASAASPRRMLILDPFGRDVAPYSAVVSAFRNTLVREFGRPVDIYELPLNLARFPEAEGEGPLVFDWRELVEYIQGDYNRSRLHCSLGYKSPVDFDNQNS